MLIIYHWEPNANSGKPLLAAAEKGVAYESRYLDMLAFDHHQPDYLAVNPQGTIPAMIHDGRMVAESLGEARCDHPEPAFAPGPETARWG